MDYYVVLTYFFLIAYEAEEIALLYAMKIFLWFFFIRNRCLYIYKLNKKLTEF